jgi:Zn-dependent protease
LYTINQFDREEARDIGISVLALFVGVTVIVYIHYPRGIFSPGGLAAFSLAAGALTAGTGFLLHELAHRQTARHFGGFARFRKWDLGIIMILITSLVGFLFAAPGAVYFTGIYDKKQVGIISALGPITNMVMGLILFTGAVLTAGSLFISGILLFAGQINLWLFLFNLIPVWQLDGAKVFAWNREAFVTLFAISILLFILTSAYLVF